MAVMSRQWIWELWVLYGFVGRLDCYCTFQYHKMARHTSELLAWSSSQDLKIAKKCCKFFPLYLAHTEVGIF